MGGIVSGITDALGITDSPSDVAADQANINRQFQQQLWERQFGPVSDALLKEMMGVLGYTQGPISPTSSPRGLFGGLFSAPTSGAWSKTGTNPWLNKFKDTMRTEIESGIRPGEEAARVALLDKVRANPRGMSSSAYAKGLKDIVSEGSKARGTAFRSGMTQAELTPLNMALTFMGRTPFAPNVNPTYPPDYKMDTEGLKMMGGGLSDVLKSGSSMYDKLFGPRGDSSGFESFMGNEGGNLGMGDLSDLEAGGVF